MVMKGVRNTAASHTEMVLKQNFSAAGISHQTDPQMVMKGVKHCCIPHSVLVQLPDNLALLKSHFKMVPDL